MAEDKEIYDKMLNLIRKSKHGLSTETIQACLALENDLELHHSLLDLCLRGEIEALFGGTPEDNIMDLDLYKFQLRNRP